MDGAATWISSIAAAVLGALGGAATVWGLWKAQINKARKAAVELAKQELELAAEEAKNKTAALDYLFQQYKVTVDRVRKEHEEDRVLLVAMQAEHQGCREELAALKERMRAAEAKLGAHSGET